MYNDNGIAWMIGGGAKPESAEDQRQVLHRIAVAEGRPSVGGKLIQLRDRIATFGGGRPEMRTDSGTLSADCCPA